MASRPTGRRKSGGPSQKVTKRIGTPKPGGARASATGIARSGGRAAASGYRFGPGPNDVTGGPATGRSLIGPPTPMPRNTGKTGSRNIATRSTTSGKGGFSTKPLGPPTPMPTPSSGGSPVNTRPLGAPKRRP